MDRVPMIVQMLSESPDDHFLKHALALEYVKAGNDGDARRIFEEILEADANYIGSYYHLGKLYERIQLVHEAEAVYRKGIDIAERLGDTHAANELRAALEDL